MKEKHPSYGMVSVNHADSTGTSLVGSAFRHRHFVTLTIHRAEKCWDSSKEWWFAEERLIQVALSEAQFIELVARPNIGDGVPCTIRWAENQLAPEPPEPELIGEKFGKDVEANASRCAKELDEALKVLDHLLSSTPGSQIPKSRLREVAKKFHGAECALVNGIPFVKECFDEHVENTIRHASAEIEATVTNIAIRLGIDQMRHVAEGAPKLLGGPCEPKE